MDTHVLTVQLDYLDGFMIHEFWRGSEHDCRELAKRFGGVASDDRAPIQATKIIVGPLHEWVAMLNSHNLGIPFERSQR